MLKMLRDLVLEPSIVVGGIVFLGLVLQRKSLEATVKGTLKSVIGFMVIRIGGNIITESVEPFGRMFQYGFHVSGVRKEPRELPWAGSGWRFPLSCCLG